MKLIDYFRQLFGEKEFHVVVEKNLIWLYFWKEGRGSKYLDKLSFKSWNEALDFLKEF